MAASKTKGLRRSKGTSGRDLLRKVPANVDLTDSEKERALRGLRSWVRLGIRAGTPRYRIVLGLQERGLKLETARAFVQLVGRDQDGVRKRPESEAGLIRRLDALVRANYQD